MRSTARRLALVALVGLLFLMWRARTDHDLVVAQTGKPIMATRIYTGPDGQSHAEEFQMKLSGTVDMLKPRSAVSRTPPVRSRLAWGPAQYVIRERSRRD